MPQRTCCVSSCTSAQIEGVTLHAFPSPSSDGERFRTWVTNAGLVGEDEDYIFKNRRICQLHFETIYHYPKNRLNRLAIPTLHLSGAIYDAAHSMEVGRSPNLQAMIADVPSSSACLLTNIMMSECTSEGTTSYRPDSMLLDDKQPSTSRKNNTTAKCTSEGTTSYRPDSMLLDDKQPSTSRKNNTTAKCLQFKSLSKTEIELYNVIAKTQTQLKRCQKTKAGLSKKLMLAKRLTYSEAYKAVTKNLTPAAKTFFDMQTRQSSRHPKGHRFTMDEKILALSLYKPSPKAYRMLSQICVLPKKSTLNKLMTKIPLSPGPNDVIFEHLKKRVNKMPTSHRFCTLIFDEMAIAANLSYDKHTDKIKGFCDDGSVRAKCYADHVLVFMIRGIFKKYKQPIAFSFCAGTTKTESLKKQLKIILKKVLETGLKVVATTCDQGSTNVAAINSLINDTKAEYLRQGKDFKGGFFRIENEEIYPIFDPPHLMKCIRNNLITKNLEYQLDGKKRTAQWAHVEALYRKGPGYKGVRLVPKLTARHVIPHLIPKMKVKYSTQVFSKTVSVAMGFTAGTGRIPRDSTDTADLLMFFDKLFDSVKGSFSKPLKGKVYRSAVKPKSPHHMLWYKSLPVLKSMRFVNGRGRGAVVPSISSWIKTIEAFQQITKKLNSLGLNSLLLRNFNQDPLENFFGAIRAHGYGNIMPSSTAFEASYKALLINNMVSPKSVGANCESDNSYCLQSLKYFLNQNIARPQGSSIEINFDHLSIDLSNIDHLLKSQTPADLEKCAAAAYCCGWLINVINKCITKSCEICKDDLEGDSEEAFSKFITLKKHTNKCILHYPNKRFLEYFVHVEEITIEILKSNCESTQISEYIELVATSVLSLNCLTCESHKKKLLNFILKKSITFFINDWCKEINHILSGKSTIWDENDPIKQLAHNHYVKNKAKKTDQ